MLDQSVPVLWSEQTVLYRIYIAFVYFALFYFFLERLSSHNCVFEVMILVKTRWERCQKQFSWHCRWNHVKLYLPERKKTNFNRFYNLAFWSLQYSKHPNYYSPDVMCTRPIPTVFFFSFWIFFPYSRWTHFMCLTFCKAKIVIPHCSKSKKNSSIQRNDSTKLPF